MDKVVIRRFSAPNDDFIQLVQALDEYLAVIDGEEHAFYDQFNAIDTLKHIVIAYKDNRPVGCGAFKVVDAATTEIKRMYTAPDFRGMGIAMSILKELEVWSKESGCESIILETGKRMPDAVSFYKKAGYLQIPSYGQYQNSENSVCFQKQFS